MFMIDMIEIKTIKEIERIEIEKEKDLDQNKDLIKEDKEIDQVKKEMIGMVETKNIKIIEMIEKNLIEEIDSMDRNYFIYFRRFRFDSPPKSDESDMSDDP
jgi:hypothetical protein